MRSLIKASLILSALLGEAFADHLLDPGIHDRGDGSFPFGSLIRRKGDEFGALLDSRLETFNVNIVPAYSRIESDIWLRHR